MPTRYCLLFCTIIIVITYAYELNNFESSPKFYSRHRRDVDDDDDFIICCGSQPKDNEDMREVNEECEKAALNNLGMKDPDDDINYLKTSTCIVECVAKYANVYLEDGTVNKTAFFEYELDDFQDDEDLKWRKEVGENQFDNCLIQAEAEAHKYSDKIKCDLIVYGLELCLWRQFETTCPEDKKVESEECTDVRELLAKNSNLYLL